MSNYISETLVGVLRDNLCKLAAEDRAAIAVELLVSCAGECQRLYAMTLDYCLPEMATVYERKRRQLNALREYVKEIIK